MKINNDVLNPEALHERMEGDLTLFPIKSSLTVVTETSCPGNAQLCHQCWMFDRITSIEDDLGIYKRHHYS